MINVFKADCSVETLLSCNFLETFRYLTKKIQQNFQDPRQLIRKGNLTTSRKLISMLWRIKSPAPLNKNVFLSLLGGSPQFTTSVWGNSRKFDWEQKNFRLGNSKMSKEKKAKAKKNGEINKVFPFYPLIRASPRQRVCKEEIN